MGTVGVDVEYIVPEVGTARPETEGDEHQQRLAERRRLIEHAGGTRRGKHQNVLEPLLRRAVRRIGCIVGRVNRSAQRYRAAR